MGGFCAGVIGRNAIILKGPDACFALNQLRIWGSDLKRQQRDLYDSWIIQLGYWNIGKNLKWGLFVLFFSDICDSF